MANIFKTPAFIEGFEEKYRIYETGLVETTYRSKRGNWRELQPGITRNGYKKVTLMIDGEKFTKNIHRLVALTFIPNPHNYPQVNHLDGNKLNNRISNLEWCTASQNIVHANNNGLQGSSHGAHGNCAKLFPEQIVETRRLSESGVKQRDIAKLYGVSQATIWSIINRTTWKHL